MQSHTRLHVHGRFSAWTTFLFVLIALLFPLPGNSTPLGETPQTVILSVFWGDGCPHCAAQKPFLHDLEQRYPELELRLFEIYRTDAHHARFIEMALAHGVEPGSVPTAFLGGRAWVGDSPQVRRELEQTLQARIAALGAAADTNPSPLTALNERNTVDIPLVGHIDLAMQPLIVTTVLIAFIDGLNPCSLWVLMLLLGLVIHSRSRSRIALVGITFLSTTALIYGAFIAGVFGVLSYVLYLHWVQWLVAAFALTFGLVNVKDYFWFRTGPSFTIAESHKPGIYRGMRKLLSPQLTGFALFFATIVMASGIALVELPCTAGFPVLWSGILAERGITGVAFLGLLAIYLFVYLFIELVIFFVALITLRMGRFEESHGRNLKLIGGLIMVALAGILLVDPGLMNDIGTTLLVFAITIGIALTIIAIHSHWKKGTSE